MGVIRKIEKALGLKTERRRRKSAKKKSRRRMPPRGKNGKFKRR